MRKGTSVLYSRSCLQEEETETVVAKFSAFLSYQDQRGLGGTSRGKGDAITDNTSVSVNEKYKNIEFMCYKVINKSIKERGEC